MTGNDRQQGTTTDNALPVRLLPAFRRGGPVPDVPQHGNVRHLLQVLDAVGFQGVVPVPDFDSGQAGDGGLAGCASMTPGRVRAVTNNSTADYYTGQSPTTSQPMLHWLSADILEFRILLASSMAAICQSQHLQSRLAKFILQRLVCSSLHIKHFVFAPDGTIIQATINTPGSWHDAVVLRDIFEALLHRTPPTYWLIGGTAFPTSKELAGRI